MSTASRAWRGGRADWKLHALSVFSLAVAFVCLGSSLLVVCNLDGIRERWARAGRVTVFLREAANEDMVSELRYALERTPGVRSVRHVSPSDARREVASEAADETLAALPAEAFPASIEVQMAETATQKDIDTMSAQLHRVAAVETVETYQRYTDKLKELLHAGVIASLVLAFVVFAAVVSVVGSTVRLALQRRQTEVEVLRLVGATEPYVRRPFVVEGCVQGLIGATSAVVVLGVLYLIVRPHASDVFVLMVGAPPTFLPWYAALGLVATGAILGSLSSYVSLRRMATV